MLDPDTLTGAPVWARELAPTLATEFTSRFANTTVSASWSTPDETLRVLTPTGTGLAARHESTGTRFSYLLDGDSSGSLDSPSAAADMLVNAWRHTTGKLTVFTTDNCQACRLTQRQLDKAGVTYLRISLADAAAERDSFIAQGLRAAPIVEVAGADRYGGFDPARLRDILATFPDVDHRPPTNAAPSSERPPQISAPARDSKRHL